MPKASMMASKALQSGYGIQDGIIKVLDARYKLIQRVKNDGSLVTPMCVLQLDVTKCDNDLQPINEEEVEQKDLIYCWGSKEKDENGNHKFAFHPAIGKDGNDQDPEDQGGEIEASGNTLVPTGNTSAMFADSECAMFAKSLELKGWKPEINDQCYAPNYVGAVFEVKTVTKAAFAKQIGIKYRSQEGRNESQDTVWEVVKVHVRPYEGKQPSKKGGKPSSSTTTTSPSKVNGEAQSDATGELAALMVKKVAESKDFKGKEGIARSKFQAAVLTQMHRDKKVKEQAAVMKLVKDDEWIIGQGGELGFIVDTDEGVMSFVAE